jgi:hypothetical protein
VEFEFNGQPQLYRGIIYSFAPAIFFDYPHLSEMVGLMFYHVKPGKIIIHIRIFSGGFLKASHRFAFLNSSNVFNRTSR